VSTDGRGFQEDSWRCYRQDTNGVGILDAAGNVMGALDSRHVGGEIGVL
jgi:hypothetical protein